ncbi:MAG: methyltransferase domain-containing protein [Desulfovibrio sp.]|nr:methyltransferase domain-containing protein [Desulfovibrio sp.]
MRRFYQESWQGIPFTAFSHISFFRLAEPKFYATFYEELFRRYKSWDDLPEQWRANKVADARWLADRLRVRQTLADESAPALRVLSIGSGVGYMEKLLLDQVPGMELYVNEPSTVGMKWLRQIIPTERIFIGLPPLCLPPDVHYDMIYLSAVDYGIPQAELIRLLQALRVQLAPGGELVCLSASLLEEDSLIGSFVNSLKIVIRGVLHYLGIRRQQFWGWRRTRNEYRQLFKQAGFTDISDGWLDSSVDTYWIRGC